MSKPIVIAYHLTWTAYGFWLPNDPRGSMSKTIAPDVIAELGELHFGRKRVQPAGWVLREFQSRAEDVLKFPALRFNAEDVAIIAGSMDEVIGKENYTCYACAIMPDHIHVLIRKRPLAASQFLCENGQFIQRFALFLARRLIDADNDRLPRLQEEISSS